MADQRPLTLATLAPVVISLVLGCIIGIEIHKYSTVGPERTSGATGPTASAVSAGGGPTAGGMGGGMGGGGNQPNSGRSLSRLVGTLSTMQKLQGKGLTADQEKKLLPILQSIKSADKLPEADAKSKLDAVQAVLNSDQTQIIADMTPQRGGRGGGGGPGAGGPGGGGGQMSMTVPGSSGMGRPNRGGGPAAGMSGGMMAGGAGMGGAMMGGGGGQDPDHPFASDRSKKALDDLIGAVGGGKK